MGGTQAVNNADFAINQFQYLAPLLLVHGRWLYYRLSLCINYFFYKNIIFSYTIAYAAFVTGFSATPIYDDMYLTIYNIIFTSVGVLAVGFFEQDISQEMSLTSPGCHLYEKGTKYQELNWTVNLFWQAEGFYGSAICFLYGYYYQAQCVSSDGRGISMIDAGNCAMTSIVITANLRLMMDLLHYTVYHWVATAGVIAIWFIFSYMYASVAPRPMDFKNNEYYYSYNIDSSMASFWLNAMVTIVTCLLPRLAHKSYLIIFHPTLLDRIRMQQFQDGDLDERLGPTESFKQSVVMNNEGTMNMRMSVVTARPRGNELAPDMLSPTGARINVNNQNLILGLESLTVKQQVGAAVGAKVFAGKLRRRTEET